jgi:hypothetical protein
MNNYTPTVYRITNEMAKRLVPLLNQSRVYVQDLKRYLNPSNLKCVASVANISSVSMVLVDEEGTGTAHRLLPYNDSYQRTWGDKPLYGNVVIVLKDTAYNELAPELQTTDLTTIRL